MDTSKIKKGNSKNTSYFFFISNSKKKKGFTNLTLKQLNP